MLRQKTPKRKKPPLEPGRRRRGAVPSRGGGASAAFRGSRGSPRRGREVPPAPVPRVGQSRRAGCAAGGKAKCAAAGAGPSSPFTASAFAACGSGTFSRWSCQGSAGGRGEVRAAAAAHGRAGEAGGSRGPGTVPTRDPPGTRTETPLAALPGAGGLRALSPPSPAHTRHANTLPLGLGTPHTHTRSQPGPRQLCGTQERGVSLEEKSWVFF